MTTVSADVAIVGSGFGGCLTALILQRIGRSVVVLDQAAHPRFAIGESSTPVADMLLRDLAMRYDLPRFLPLCQYRSWKQTYPHIVCGPKRGFSYFRHENGRLFENDENHHNELLVAASATEDVADTHWFRSDVDAFFADTVRKAGIPVWERTTVTTVKPTDNAWNITANQSGSPIAIRARFVVDASGAGGLLPQQLGIRVSADELQTRSRAVFSHFRNVEPWTNRLNSTADHPFPSDAAALHHVFDDGWMWQLRFDGGITSVGFVFDERRRPLNAKRSPREEWDARLAQHPSIAAQFSHAESVDPPGRLIRTQRLQRIVDRITGPNWALLPHTAGFVDPLHSTGIAHTLCGIEKLTAVIEHHWEKETLDEQLQRYAKTVRAEFLLIDRLVASCYAGLQDFRLFATACMLYFAAVTSFEQRRKAMREMENELPPAFLLANDPTFREIVEDCRQRIVQAANGDIATSECVRFVEAAITPYNTVGLFRPTVPNMYHHTAAEK